MYYVYWCKVHSRSPVKTCTSTIFTNPSEKAIQLTLYGHRIEYTVNKRRTNMTNALTKESKISSPYFVMWMRALRTSGFWQIREPACLCACLYNEKEPSIESTASSTSSSNVFAIRSGRTQSISVSNNGIFIQWDILLNVNESAARSPALFGSHFILYYFRCFCPVVGGMKCGLRCG